jgi:hypothetical protein
MISKVWISFVPIIHLNVSPLFTPERLSKMTEFQKFMAEVDGCLISKLGLSSASIADAPWRDWFEDEMEVEVCCAIALYDYNDVPFDTLVSIGLGDYI